MFLSPGGSKEGSSSQELSAGYLSPADHSEPWFLKYIVYLLLLSMLTALSLGRPSQKDRSFKFRVAFLFLPKLGSHGKC